MYSYNKHSTVIYNYNLRTVKYSLEEVLNVETANNHLNFCFDFFLNNKINQEITNYEKNTICY